MSRPSSKARGNVVEADFKAASGERAAVAKTYKIYVDGKFPRSESGRSYPLPGPDGDTLANVCRCSRKDVRDAVTAARKAAPGWAAKNAALRGQILYRIAEMLEGRAAQFRDEIESLGATADKARREVSRTIDRLLYFAGWTDKYQQMFGSVNPVASPHFNFSMPEPVGVVGIAAPEPCALLGAVAMLAPVIAGGNTVVMLASASKALPLVTFGEVLQTSDVPAGVVNILTGLREEMLETLAGHMDVNALVASELSEDDTRLAQTKAADNVKRVALLEAEFLESDRAENPYLLMETQEIKTTWHPIGI